MLTQRSVVANLLDRVCVYLFQFKVLDAYTTRRQRTKLKQRNERETQREETFVFMPRRALYG